MFEVLSAGSIHLSALMLIRPHFTQENHREWLMATSGKSKREVEKFIAARCPKPDVAARVRRSPQADSVAPRLPAFDPGQSARFGLEAAPPFGSVMPKVDMQNGYTGANRWQRWLFRREFGHDLGVIRAVAPGIGTPMGCGGYAANETERLATTGGVEPVGWIAASWRSNVVESLRQHALQT